MANAAAISRYLQTVRRLRPVQVYGRIWFRLVRPKANTRPAPPQRPSSETWVLPARRRSSLTESGQFCFLNEVGTALDSEWDDPGREKLWRYNQHYFDDLNATDAPERKIRHLALLQDWVASNPPEQGTGWEPYPTSLRIVNWIKWSFAGNDLSYECRQSLAVQARWLMLRLEWHLLGNHLFANAKALIFAGLWFEGEEARTWLDTGFRILKREFSEQILPDGGQFELSPMYHALALEDVLDLVNITRNCLVGLSQSQKVASEEWAQKVPEMRRWLAGLSHPDDKIAFFNDAAFDIAPSNSEIESYSERLDLASPIELDPVTWFQDSGYVRLSHPNALLIADMARVGPDYLPGHAHADTLSFELSLFGHRIFVNSGTSVYGTSVERLRQRSTPAHNTVTIAGENSSDVWSGFRVGRRASPLDANVSEEGDTFVAEAAHDGYHHLPGKPLHRRRWHLTPGSLHIDDTVSPADIAAEARFHLHPAIEIKQGPANCGTMFLPDGRTVAWSSDGGEARLEPATWHPEFGVSQPSTCLAIALRDGRLTFNVSWT